MTQKTVLCIIGTRPEAIKMAPIIWALQKESWVKLRILATAQHREMLDQMLSLFDIHTDLDLNIMQTNQSLSELTSRLIDKIGKVLHQEKPAIVLGQGDTTTVFAAALSSFYSHIPFGHVEAGLRTHDLYHPFPEEGNRVLAGQLSALHFAPTATAKNALLREGITESKIYITGNTVIDTLLEMAKQIENTHQNSIKNFNIDKNKKLILVTAHRRENFGDAFLNICEALRTLADEYTDIQIIYPVHPNPHVYQTAHQVLGQHPRIILSQPLEYLPFIALMKQCYCILTDSGGVQEEAPALAKPVLVFRNETERPEAVEAGVVKLIGTDYENIINQTRKLLIDTDYYHAMTKGVSPYGDGKAAEKIINILKKYLHSNDS